MGLPTRVVNRRRSRRPGYWWWADNSIFTLGLTLEELGVYLNLCRRADVEGESFPGVPKIATDIGISERSVRYAIYGGAKRHGLIERGLLSIHPQPGHTNLYTVFSPAETGAISEIVEMTPARRAAQPCTPCSPTPARRAAEEEAVEEEAMKKTAKSKSKPVHFPKAKVRAEIPPPSPRNADNGDNPLLL